MNSVVEAFLEAGVNCMHPIEPAAGMDPVALRRQYGDRLAMRGGIDKHVLRRSKPEIADELRRKIPSLVASGGYEIALDHRIPNGTPLENYRFYVETVWQILDEMGAG
jgi:uroporphyrinogen-III decarboxylase